MDVAFQKKKILCGFIITGIWLTVQLVAAAHFLLSCFINLIPTSLTLQNLSRSVFIFISFTASPRLTQPFATRCLAYKLVVLLLG